MDPVVELSEADEIVRRILTKQSVSEDEFRYVAMFNLTAMTQLLWEISSAQGDMSENKPRTTRGGSSSRGGLADVRNKVKKLVPLAAVVAFLAGLGLGYMIP